MKELINNELAQLQKDLENLQSASKMISQAGEASNSVIAEAKGIQEEFSRNLESLTNLYTQYLEAANKQSSQNQLLVVDHVKKTISEQGAVLDKYTQLVETSNSNTKAMYAKAVEDLKKNSDEASQNVETVKSTYLKQSAETDKLLASYLELAESTAELKGKIEAVDFPSRLDTLCNRVEELANKQKAANEAIAAKQKADSEAMAAQLQKIIELASSDLELKQAKENRKAIASVKTTVSILTFLVILGLAGVAYIIIKQLGLL